MKLNLSTVNGREIADMEREAGASLETLQDRQGELTIGMNWIAARRKNPTITYAEVGEWTFHKLNSLEVTGALGEEPPPIEAAS